MDSLRRVGSTEQGDDPRVIRLRLIQLRPQCRTQQRGFMHADSLHRHVTRDEHFGNGVQQLFGDRDKSIEAGAGECFGESDIFAPETTFSQPSRNATWGTITSRSEQWCEP